MPTEEKWDDPVFQQFLAWRYDQIAGWRASLYDLAKREDRCVFFQGAFPLASLPGNAIQLSGAPPVPSYYRERFGVSWHVPMAHADDMARTAATGDVVHMELYRSSVGEPLWWYGVALRYIQAIAKGKPILVLSMMAQSPFDLLWLGRNRTAPVHGRTAGRIMPRCYSPAIIPTRSISLPGIGCMSASPEAEALAPYLLGRQSIPYAALLYSQTTFERFDSREGKPSHLGELKGFAKALLQEKVLFDVISEADLCAGISQYQVLILPNASCLSAECKAALRAYAAAGGGVVASYETGMYGTTGHRQAADDLATVFWRTIQRARRCPSSLISICK